MGYLEDYLKANEDTVTKFKDKVTNEIRNEKYSEAIKYIQAIQKLMIKEYEILQEIVNESQGDEVFLNYSGNRIKAEDKLNELMSSICIKKDFIKKYSEKIKDEKIKEIEKGIVKKRKLLQNWENFKKILDSTPQIKGGIEN